MNSSKRESHVFEIIIYLKKGKKGSVPKPNSCIYMLIFSLLHQDNNFAQESRAVWETGYRTTAARQRSWIPSLWENKEFLELVSAQIEQKYKEKINTTNPQLFKCWKLVGSFTNPAKLQKGKFHSGTESTRDAGPRADVTRPPMTNSSLVSGRTCQTQP